MLQKQVSVIWEYICIKVPVLILIWNTWVHISVQQMKATFVTWDSEKHTWRYHNFPLKTTTKIQKLVKVCRFGKV